MKNLVVRTAMVKSEDMGEFHKALTETINDYQQTLEVEIHYSHTQDFFSALIVGRATIYQQEN